jgi:hypothetical protein
MLCESSIPYDYYLGDLPGTLQYKKEPEEIINCVIPDDNFNDRGFRFCEHSEENLRRVLPLSQTNIKWKILLMMRAECEDGEIWLKAALENRETGKIALLTASNRAENILKRGNRTAKTVDGEWFVGRYRMSAPIVFWRELRNRILY